jgi:hypothetical protein
MTKWTEEQLEAVLKSNASLRVAGAVGRSDANQGESMGESKIVHPEKPQEVLAVKKERKPRGPNKTELRFYKDHVAWRSVPKIAVWEGLRLKLAEGVIYVPDWVVYFGDNSTTGPNWIYCFEVKSAFIRNPGRARTKFFVAREQWPCFRFEAWQYLGKKDGWREIWK